MAYFIEPLVQNATKAVGIIDTTVQASTDCRGHDSLLVVLTNASATETFNGRASSSPDGTNQWADVDDDAFQAMGPGTTRRMTLLARDHLFIRVVGHFDGAPDNMNVSVIRLRSATRRA